MSLIRAIFGFSLVVVLTLFAIFNRESVTVVYSPAYHSIDLPLYLIALCFLAVGFFVGGLFVWLNGTDVRKAKRKSEKSLKSLEKEIESLGLDPKKPGAPPADDLFPALLSKPNPAFKKG